MRLNPDDVHSLTDFKRNTTGHLRQLARTGRAGLLTVNGRAKVVVQDAEAYQKLLEAVDRAEAIAGIQRGLDDVKAGRVLTLEEVRRDLTRHVKSMKRKMKRKSK